MKLGDDYQYPIKGVREASYILESGKHLKMKDVLYVPGLKKNLLSSLVLEKKGFRVSFVDGKVLMWPKGKTIDDVVVIGVQEGDLLPPDFASMYMMQKLKNMYLISEVNRVMDPFFFYTTLSHPHGKIVINDESMMNYVTR